MLLARTTLISGCPCSPALTGTVPGCVQHRASHLATVLGNSGWGGQRGLWLAVKVTLLLVCLAQESLFLLEDSCCTGPWQGTYWFWQRAPPNLVLGLVCTAG